jgi:hypothetical protein
VGSEYGFELSSTLPAVPTGMEIRAVYRDPEDPEGKPPPLEEVVIEMPAGLAWDTGVVPSCEASDDELRAEGRAACPAESRIGSGTLTAITGFPGVDPVETDITIFNGGDELIELVSFKGTDVTAGSDRLKIQGDTLVAHPPAVPGGPPNGRTTVREIAFTIDRHVTAGPGRRRSLIATPPDCPAGGWRSSLSFTFASYAPSSAVDHSQCMAQGASVRPPRMSLSVRPRRLRAGRPATIRARLRSTAPGCRGSVRIRLAGRRALTNARGRARLRVRFARPGPRLVRASKSGCRSARARLLVR